MFFKRSATSNTASHKRALQAGYDAEARAEAYLIAQGLVPHAKNFRCKLGEIDLVMHHQATLVFIEVRLRSHREFASAAESVTLSKQRKIIKAAHYYLQQHHLTDNTDCRFDIVTFDHAMNPEWIQHAFDA